MAESKDSTEVGLPLSEQGKEESTLKDKQLVTKPDRESLTEHKEPIAETAEISEIAHKEQTPLVLKVSSMKPKKRSKGIYMNSLITKKVSIPVNMIGRNIKENLEKIIVQEIEGRCIAEGYIKPGSVEIITYSSGMLKDSIALFDIVLTCQICLPVEGMLIDCIAKNITKAGIRAETNEDTSPVTIFIARDHHFTNELFSKVKENDEIRIRVIGQRFELFDKTISVIGEITKQKNNRGYKGRSFTSQRKPTLIIPEN